MNNPSFISRSLRRFLLPCLAVLAACVLLAPAAAFATPYAVTLKQQGSNVVATGSGAIDLTGLTFFNLFYGQPAIIPVQGWIGIGEGVPYDTYVGATGPASFGGGVGGADASTAAGDPVAVISSGFFTPFIYVPHGYLSGTALNGTATWDNATFASLGVTPGTYLWTWGNGAEQSFTLEVDTAVPEPATLGMFGFGVLLIGAFVGLRRRLA